MKSKLVIILSFLLLATIGTFLWWAFSPLLFDTEVQDELNPALKAKLETERRTQNENTNDDKVIEKSNASVISQGPFPITGTPGHTAHGNVEIIKSPEETLLHYINYEGTNGPDLYVYLAKDLEANDYINLGAQRGNKGNIIYNIPSDVDLSKYKYVITWCKAFGVLFDYAEIR